MMKFLNQSGQALVETFWTIKVMLTGVSLALGGLHCLFFYYLVDHWTYESAFCLLKEVPEVECRNQFLKKVSLIPFSQFDLKDFSRRGDAVRVRIEGSTFFLEKIVFEEKIFARLRGSDFGRRQ